MAKLWDRAGLDWWEEPAGVSRGPGGRPIWSSRRALQLGSSGSPHSPLGPPPGPRSRPPALPLACIPRPPPGAFLVALLFSGWWCGLEQGRWLGWVEVRDVRARAPGDPGGGQPGEAGAHHRLVPPGPPPSCLLFSSASSLAAWSTPGRIAGTLWVFSPPWVAWSLVLAPDAGGVFKQLWTLHP